jgi:S1-C subfamily serine protease
VRLEEKDGAVHITSITAGSLAEKSGLKADDQVLEVAGLPVNRNLQVIAAIRLQPAGTWLPLRVRRGDQTLDLVVKFPAQQ